MTDYLAEYKEAQATIRKAQEEAKAVAAKAFSHAAEALFNAFPVVGGFSWTQYTPFFNDGDECTFSAHVEYPTIWEPSTSEDDILEYSYDETGPFQPYGEDSKVAKTFNVYETREEPNAWGSHTRYTKCVGEKPNPNYSEEHVKAREAVLGFLKEWDESTLKDMFGDHVKVVVTREGTTVEEYEHE